MVIVCYSSIQYFLDNLPQYFRSIKEKIELRILWPALANSSLALSTEESLFVTFSN